MTQKTAFAFLIPFAFSAPAASAFADVAGYRAVYDIAFGSSDAASGITGAEGRYVFDLEDVCEGYTLNERFVVQLSRRGGPTLQDYRLTAFESASGDHYRFKRTIDLNGKQTQKAGGTLNIDAGGEKSDVSYDTADDISYDTVVLPPVMHVIELLETAKAGEKRHAATVFDGDVDTPAFYAVTRLNALSDNEKTQGDHYEALSGLERWKIDSVYYPFENNGDDQGATPDFLFEGVLYENGVITDLQLDYVDFELTTALSDLEVREKDC